MIKEEKPIFLKIFSIILVTLVTEAIAIFYASRSGYPIPTKLILAQIPLILFILGFAYLKNRRIWQRKVDEYGINLKEVKRGSKTDLDVLYTILKNKKEISVRSISNLFKIQEDLAMEWARILENGELVTIEYPGFGSPKVLIKEQEKNVTMIPDPRTKKKEMKKNTPENSKESKNENSKKGVHKMSVPIKKKNHEIKKKPTIKKKVVKKTVKKVQKKK